MLLCWLFRQAPFGVHLHPLNVMFPGILTTKILPYVPQWVGTVVIPPRLKTIDVNRALYTVVFVVVLFFLFIMEPLESLSWEVTYLTLKKKKMTILAHLWRIE